MKPRFLIAACVVLMLFVVASRHGYWVIAAMGVPVVLFIDQRARRDLRKCVRARCLALRELAFDDLAAMEGAEDDHTEYATLGQRLAVIDVAVRHSAPHTLRIGVRGSMDVLFYTIVRLDGFDATREGDTGPIKSAELDSSFDSSLSIALGVRLPGRRAAESYVRLPFFPLSGSGFRLTVGDDGGVHGWTDIQVPPGNYPVTLSVVEGQVRAVCLDGPAAGGELAEYETTYVIPEGSVFCLTDTRHTQPSLGPLLRDKTILAELDGALAKVVTPSWLDTPTLLIGPTAYAFQALWRITWRHGGDVPSQIVLESCV